MILSIKYRIKSLYAVLLSRPPFANCNIISVVNSKLLILPLKLCLTYRVKRAHQIALFSLKSGGGGGYVKGGGGKLTPKQGYQACHLTLLNLMGLTPR